MLGQLHRGGALELLVLFAVGCLEGGGRGLVGVGVMAGVVGGRVLLRWGSSCSMRAIAELADFFCMQGSNK